MVCHAEGSHLAYCLTAPPFTPEDIDAAHIRASHINADVPEDRPILLAVAYLRVSTREQAFYTRLDITDTEELRPKLAEPFATILRASTSEDESDGAGNGPGDAKREHFGWSIGGPHAYGAGGTPTESPH